MEKELVLENEKDTKAYDTSDQYHRPIYLTSPQMAGNDVKRVQRRLNVYQYNAGTEDGYFGPNSKEAVKRFQAENGLTVDGSCGPATWKKLIDNGGKNVYVRRYVAGQYIVVSVKTVPALEIKNNAAMGKALAGATLASRTIARELKVRFREVYSREINIKDDSLALEILGHYYPDRILKGAISSGLPQSFIDAMKKIQNRTGVTDAGESSCDNNRWLWDLGAPFYSVLAAFSMESA